MLLRIYVSDKNVISYLDDNEYNICTIRNILKRNYGFKNTEEILKKYSPIIDERFLKIKLAYKNDSEYAELSLYLSRFITFIESRLKDQSMIISIRGFHLLYFHQDSHIGGYFLGDSTNSLIKFHFKTVYSKLIKKEPCFNKYINYGEQKSTYYLS